MQRAIVTTMAVVFVFAFSGISSADTTDGVRSSYAGSTDLPDEIAFTAYLRVVDKENDHILEYVATAIGIPLSDDTRAHIAQRTDFFRNVHKALREEKEKTAYEMLCPENRASRTKDETYNVLNNIDDVSETIARKHYLQTVSALPVAERNAFQKFLDKKKTGIGYTKIDSRYMEETGDVRVGVEQRCIELALGRI
jgi:hypothetical protein